VGRRTRQSALIVKLVGRSPATRTPLQPATPGRPVEGRRLLAANIRALRLEGGLSQEALVELAGIHRTYLGLSGTSGTQHRDRQCLSHRVGARSGPRNLARLKVIPRDNRSGVGWRHDMPVIFVR
jgi:hypothetical protein